jgi:SSS family transporter
MDPATLWKIVGVSVYLLALLSIGIAASFRMKDVKDYFAGGKQLGFWAVAFSARATGESAWLLLGLTGMGAALGVHAFWVVVGEVLGVMGAWLLLSKRFKRLTDRYDSITVPDYLESRFRDRSKILRIVSALALLVFVTIYVSAQIDATGKAFEEFIGLTYLPESWALAVTSGDGFFAENAAWLFGILIGFTVVLTYSTFGGFLAVVWSDIFQGVLMFFGLVTLPLVGLWAAGGPSVVYSDLMAIDPGLLSIFGPSGFSIKALFGILGLALIGLGFLGSPQIFVRFLALKSDTEIPKGAAVAFVWTLLADSGAVLTGIVGRSLVHRDHSASTELENGSWEGILPHMVETLLPAVLIGLFIAIVLSAIMSTVDSLLVLAASALARDVYQKVFRTDITDTQLLSISRFATFGLAIIALIIALSVGYLAEERTIFWFVIFGWSGIAATFCPTLILSLFWSKMTRYGAIASMIAGFLCVPLFKFVPPLILAVLPLEPIEWLIAMGELPPAFLVAGIAGILVSIIHPPSTEEVEEVRRELSAAGG